MTSTCSCRFLVSLIVVYVVCMRIDGYVLQPLSNIRSFGGNKRFQMSSEVTSQLDETAVVDLESSNTVDDMIADIFTNDSQAPTLSASEEQAEVEGMGSYIMCSSCKTVYMVPENNIGKKGSRVKCR